MRSTEKSAGPRPARAYHHGNLREALIDGALALLAEGGLQGFSVAKVAKRIDVSPGAPYRHFADRADLLAAVAASSTAMLVEAMKCAVAAAGPLPDEQLAATAGAYTRFVLAHGVGLELTFSPEFRGSRYAHVHEQGRALLSILLPLAHAASPGAEFNASLVLLEGHLAIAQGFAALQRQGTFTVRSLDNQQVADRATAASLTLIRGTHAGTLRP